MDANRRYIPEVSTIPTWRMFSRLPFNPSNFEMKNPLSFSGRSRKQPKSPIHKVGSGHRGSEESIPDSRHHPESRTGLMNELPDGLTNEKFNELLAKYPHYIRDVYQHAENARFETIPRKLEKLKAKCLTKEELILMDQWAQKRGVHLKKDKHTANEARIRANSKSKVKDVTKKAFQQYSGTGTSADQAMRTLEGLHGVGRARASLLLSVAYPDTVAFFSTGLYRWTHWDKNSGWAQEVEWSHRTEMALLQKVNDIRKRYSVKGKVATAVQVEQVAFVVEHETGMRHLKNVMISDALADREKIIAQGNAQVFKIDRAAIDGRRGHVALKKIYKYGQFSSANNKRFMPEVVASNYLAKRSPDHFIELLGWNEDKDFYYIAMEYIGLGDLESHIKNSRWPDRDIKATTEQVLKGLDVMHRAGFAHRDLKPQNILVVCKDPGKIQIKITDFGLAKRLSVRNTTLLVTTNIGTSGYKAPEVLKRWDAEDDAPPDVKFNTRYSYTFKADLWSLGCIIFKMAAGKRLFVEDTQVSDPKVRKKLLKGVRKSLTKAPTPLGLPGVKFIQKLIVENETDRYNAAQALENFSDWTIGG
ncbi:kinase-like protein [Hypoxylon sp. FL1284]|nr:kinase-like protein [Hypoxylon sp. FL1284]